MAPVAVRRIRKNTRRNPLDAQLRQRIERAAAVLKRFGAREVYVFGSAVSGTRHPGSDVDLAVAGLPPQDFFQAMAQAHDALGCQLDLIDLDEENLFTEYLKRKGKLQRVP
jgi:predicted nucleotidyltransferase